MSNNSHVNTLEVVNGGQAVMSISDITLARNKKLFGDAVMKAHAQIMRGLKPVKESKPVVLDEQVIVVLPREMYRSRQEYRYELRKWAKQVRRFESAHSRGELAPHLVAHLDTI